MMRMRMVRLPKKKTDFFFLFLFMKLGLPGVLFVGGAGVVVVVVGAAVVVVTGLKGITLISD